MLLLLADATPPRFCGACGQETTVKPPTLGEFVQQFGGAYLSTEGALWRTLKLLLLKPGELTRLYLAGQRKHFLLPLRLYLTISVLMLLALRISGALQVELDAPPVEVASGKKPDVSIMTFDDGTGMGLRNGVFYCDNFPAWMCKRAQRRLDIDPKAVAEAVDQFKDRYIGNIGAAMFLLLPSFALWLKLVYLNRRLRYTEHLVFALHVHAYWFLAFALMLSGVKALVLVGALAVPWYTLAAMRRVYGGRRWPRLLRAAVVTLLYAVLLGLAMGLVALWSLLF
ncbi:MAG: DUF3667 domain-containing protein [Rubrivivax sp.]|nr:DUF3667 domain-containing protein [Rubrivivax sp.]